MAELKKVIISGGNISENEATAKHEAWFNSFKNNYTFTEENTEEILRSEIGKTFVRVLEDAGVYKNTESGRAAMLRFIKAVNA